MKDPDLLQRKNDHLDIVLNPNRAVKQTTTGFERWRFEHCALPELNLDAIDLSTSLCGRAMQAPILISSMTGGATGRVTLTVIWLRRRKCSAWRWASARSV